MINQTIKLNNNVEMPMLGYGVFQISDQTECENCVYEALKAGYRLIDTAAAYMNEEAVGKAIIRSGIDRNEIFVTTKLWIQDAGYENTMKAFETSLNKLGLKYIDLYLIHQPYGDYYGSWRAMEELYNQGKIRAIGVSNFSSERIVDLIIHNKVTPAVNQIELHPFHHQNIEMEVMKKYGVQVENWGPFAEGQNDIFNNTTLSKIGEKYGKTVGQVILRWHLQRGVVSIPKSVRHERIKENFNIWDFELSETDMREIEQMDTKKGLFVDHGTYKVAEMLNSYKIHA